MGAAPAEEEGERGVAGPTCTEKAVMTKSPPRFSMISSAWLISPWSNRWPCRASTGRASARAGLVVG